MTTRADVVDLSAPPSQDPEALVANADGETGIATSVQMGVGGEIELNGGEVAGGAIAHFGISGAYGLVTDATFVPDDNNVGTASQFAPGQRYSDGFLNEKAVEFGHVTEGNAVDQNRPDGVSADVALIDGT